MILRVNNTLCIFKFIIKEIRMTANQNKWHPEPANHVGNGGMNNDYYEVWEFPCCKKQIFSDTAPPQDSSDGCKLKQ